jgi:hypothetical protein
MTPRTLPFSVCVFSLVVLGSCQRKESQQTASPTPALASSSTSATRPFHDLREIPGTVFDVSYTPATVRVDESSWRRSLKSISSDGSVFVFDNPEDRIKSLAAGGILFLENLSVRKVVTTATQEGHFALKTTPAGIPDLIQNGKIQWKVPVKFGSLYARGPSTAAPDSRILPAWLTRLNPEGVVYADSGTVINLSGKESGWNYKINVTPSYNRLDTSFSVNKELDGLIVLFNAKGFLKDFISSADIQVHDGEMESFTYDNSGMNGELNVDFEAGRDNGSTAKMDEINIKLPTLAKVPFPVGGVPFVVSVNANLILQPGFGGNKETMKGSFQVSYNGDEGISVKAGQSSATGALSGDGNIGQMLSASVAPHAILIGVAAPKITLSLGTQSAADMLTGGLGLLSSSFADSLADVFSRTDPGKWAKEKVDAFKTEASASVQNIAILTVTSAGAASMIPCKLSHLTLEYKAGVDVTFLGKKGVDKDIVLFKKDYAIREPDINACGEK